MSNVQLRSKSVKAHCFSQNNNDLSISKLEYPNIYIPNRGLAISLSLKDESDEMVVKIKSDIAEYNAYIDFITSIDGFWDVFKSNGYYISKEECESQFGKACAEKIFSLKKYQFQPGICKNKKWLFHLDTKWKYYVEVNDCKIEFETEETDGGYPDKVSIGNQRYDLFWNWYDDERDFCFYLWQKADFREWINCPNDDSESMKKYSHFEYYDQDRECMDSPDPNLMRVFKLLQDMGYLTVYYIESDEENPIWQLRSDSNGKIGLMLLDNSFEKNPLIMEKVMLLLNCAEDYLDDFFLTNEEGHQYFSKTKGSFGGHNKLKIYGKMDCPSANKYVKEGEYVQHRVFFPDEKTARNAGYRPCAKCMPREYKGWKEQRDR